MTESVLSESISLDGIEYEPFDARCHARMFEYYDLLRENRPVYRTASGYWVITRYDDLREVLLHPDRFSSVANHTEGFGLPKDIDPAADPEAVERLKVFAAGMPVNPMELLTARPIVAADPPQHTRIRSLVNRGFTPRRIAAMEEHVHTIVDDCLAGIESTDRFDVVGKLAVPLPVRLITEMLSLPPERCDDVKRWSDGLVSQLGAQRGTPEAIADLMAMFTDFSKCFVPEIEARRAAPVDDLLSDLVRANESDQLSIMEAVLFIYTLMFGGNDTTTKLIGSLIVGLMRNPDQMDILIQRPELLPNAIEEAARLWSPFQFDFREAVEDTTLGGVDIPAGEVVLALFGAANRDPRRFPDADRFDVTRDLSGSASVAFGKGIHFCIGSHLSKLEIRVAMEKLLPHLTRMRLDEDSLQLTDGLNMSGFNRIELVRT
jgi:cytochrome P450